MQLGRGAADVARRSLAVPDGLPRPFPSLGAAHNVLRVVSTRGCFILLQGEFQSSFLLKREHILT